jgi:hypothetical protein
MSLLPTSFTLGKEQGMRHKTLGYSPFFYGCSFVLSSHIYITTQIVLISDVQSMVQGFTHTERKKLSGAQT